MLDGRNDILTFHSELERLLGRCVVTKYGEIKMQKVQIGN